MGLGLGASMGAGISVSVSTLRRAAAAAAPIGISAPKFWRYKLGAFEITTIADSEAFIDGPYPIIGKNATEEEVRTLMRANLVPETRYQPGFSPALVNTGKELVLFDTGNGASGFIARPNGGWLKDQLGPAGFKADDVDTVRDRGCRIRLLGTGRKTHRRTRKAGVGLPRQHSAGFRKIQNDCAG